ncbi:serine O-acetyltransferase [Massilia sp. erpn]|uniref:serine O-acetyltransferase n=1 Tax=Massilia sp. erpn TaxID=2738142 RepID=UPI00210624A1|nr:serine O-acetyltransferase [Massilia sp. erpn]
MLDRLVAESDTVWSRLRIEAAETARQEPLLKSLLCVLVLNCPSLESALARLIAGKLAAPLLPEEDLYAPALQVCQRARGLGNAVRRDLLAAVERDPACNSLVHPFTNHKGFQALQTYRIAHELWQEGRRSLASHIQARASEVFGVDIHPAARIGTGVFIDHATGVVIGETSVVADDVSMFQDVTLGGTGKESGDRHPKVERGVLLCAGAKVLGNVRIRVGAKVGAGSVVLGDVAPYTTVVGVPARPTARSRQDDMLHWQPADAASLAIDSLCLPKV